MLQKLLARFRRVKTVKEWKHEAQSAMAAKEFVVESLAELHRVEAQERATQTMDRTRTQQPQPMQAQNPSSYFKTMENEKAKDESRKKSLKELMEEVARQQNLNNG